MPISTKKQDDNIKHLRSALDNLKKMVNDQKIVIKSADKGDITVIMTREFYIDMCMAELSKPKFYLPIGDIDPSPQVKEAVYLFAVKHKAILTKKEFECLTMNNYEMANFYTVPKLHKCVALNDILKKTNQKYIQISDFPYKIE